MAIHLSRLWLTDFRSYETVDIRLSPGTTAVIGANGEGKTNLLEAIAWLAGTSLRGAANDTLVRLGAPRAVIRAEATRGNRDLLLEAELVVNGRNRFQLNRQPVRRQRDLREALTVTVFSPDDLVLVKGGPGERRGWLDDAMVAMDPRLEAACSDHDRVLRQRNALLKGVKGRLDASAALTLDVLDDKLTGAGRALVDARHGALEVLVPAIAVAYRDIAGVDVRIEGRYEAAWARAGLAAAIADARKDDLRRGVTTVGPHRDDVSFTIDGLPSRTHASQGEQRTLSLSFRLAAHRSVRDATGESPILLLDDVLSELDDGRTHALLDHLPAGQTLLSSAGPLPDRATPDLVLHVVDGVVVAPDDGPGAAPGGLPSGRGSGA